MRGRLTSAPTRAPMGMAPLKTPQTVPLARSVWQRCLRVSVGMVPRQTTMQPKQKEERAMFQHMATDLQKELQVVRLSMRGLLSAMALLYLTILSDAIRYRLTRAPSPQLSYHSIITASMQGHPRSSQQGHPRSSQQTYSQYSFSHSSPNYSTHPHNCPYCRLHPQIIHKIALLHQAILQKNSKIRELQDFIGRLSAMALGEGEPPQPSLPSHSDYESSVHETINSKQLTFAQPMFRQEHVNATAFESGSESAASSALSQAEHSAIKQSIKQQVRKISLGDESTSNFSKESVLRSKLADIMNVLPRSEQNSQASFTSESELHPEGSVGLINSKAARALGLQ